jgi:hypothetical protein
MSCVSMELQFNISETNPVSIIRIIILCIVLMMEAASTSENVSNLLPGYMAQHLEYSHFIHPTMRTRNRTNCSTTMAKHSSFCLEMLNAASIYAMTYVPSEHNMQHVITDTYNITESTSKFP